MLVDVEFPITTFVKFARVATKLAKNPFVEVAFDASKLEVEALVIVALVVVEFPKTALVMLASVATRDEKKPLVLVLLVEKRLVAVRAVADAVASTV